MRGRVRGLIAATVVGMASTAWAERPVGAADAAGLIGRWQSATAELELHVDGEQVAGSWLVTRECASARPLRSLVQLSDGRYRLEFEGPGATFAARLDGDMLRGEYRAGAPAGVFTLARAPVQEPPEPPPYTEEQVVVPSGALALAGTLTRPAGVARPPAVVLIGDLGPDERDGCFLGLRSFARIADAFARAGIAVLRTDDRGVGGSTGQFAAATPIDFAADTAAWVGYLRGRDDVDGARIGLVGYGEGGVIAPLVASEDARIAFVVLLAGFGQRYPDLIVARSAAIGRTLRHSETEIAAQGRLLRGIAAVLRTEKDSQRIARAFAAVVKKTLAPSIIAAAGGMAALVTGLIERYDTPAFRFYLDYDPTQTLARLRCPVLAVHGALDTEVPARPNRSAIHFALTRGNNRQFKTIELPRLNHRFQHAETGSPTEYARLPAELDAALLDTVTAWVAARLH